MISSLRDEPNSKLDLFYDPRGQLGSGEEPRGPVYILRLWTFGDGRGWVKEIRLQPHEFTTLLNAGQEQAKVTGAVEQATKGEVEN